MLGLEDFVDVFVATEKLCPVLKSNPQLVQITAALVMGILQPGQWASGIGCLGSGATFCGTRVCTLNFFG
jgi:hypothetical protein